MINMFTRDDQLQVTMSQIEWTIQRKKINGQKKERKQFSKSRYDDSAI